MAHTWHLLGSPSPVLFRPKVIHPSLSLHLQGVSCLVILRERNAEKVNPSCFFPSSP